MKLYIANWADENTLDDAHEWGLEDFAAPMGIVHKYAFDAVEACKADALDSAKISFEDDAVTFEWRDLPDGGAELWVDGDPANPNGPYRYSIVTVAAIEVAI
jgi:hypothetical protein